MIVVVGHVIVNESGLAQALGESLRHVRRSRAEPGCLAHGVHQDVENPRRLVFVEQWSDMAALRQHFGLPESRAFVKMLAGLADAKPGMAIYEATVVQP